MDQAARFIIGHADAITALLLVLCALEAIADTRRESDYRRALRAAGYCAHPTSRGGNCRNRPGPPGGRCGANHPDVLLLPSYPIGSVVVLLLLAALLWYVHPFAHYLVPRLPAGLR